MRHPCSNFRSWLMQLGFAELGVQVLERLECRLEAVLVAAQWARIVRKESMQRVQWRRLQPLERRRWRRRRRRKRLWRRQRSKVHPCSKLWVLH
ncbi:hypothetical protein KC19_VG295400 [Ceratodon purpureus]|uniref:Uncharacterized protein n=1 Tax=Ceratodon purpureus TaxID=3225 RepID=A0A8T0HVH7_CERPU|nr:hypothetical protein KC19_VG295400 [Ceratodon purpureus]